MAPWLRFLNSGEGRRRKRGRLTYFSTCDPGLGKVHASHLLTEPDRGGAWGGNEMVTRTVDTGDTGVVGWNGLSPFTIPHVQMNSR